MQETRTGSQNLLPRLSIGICLLLVLNLYSYDDLSSTLVFPVIIPLFLSLVIILVLLVLPPIQSIMSGPNILKLITIIFVNWFMMKFFVLFMSLPMIKLQTYSLNQCLVLAMNILWANWCLLITHINLRGDVNQRRSCRQLRTKISPNSLYSDCIFQNNLYS